MRFRDPSFPGALDQRVSPSNPALLNAAQHFYMQLLLHWHFLEVFIVSVNECRCIRRAGSSYL